MCCLDVAGLQGDHGVLVDVAVAAGFETTSECFEVKGVEACLPKTLPVVGSCGVECLDEVSKCVGQDAGAGVARDGTGDGWSKEEGSEVVERFCGPE